MKKLIILVLAIGFIGVTCKHSFADLVLKTDTLTESKDKIAYSYKAQEELRLLHNQKSQDYKDGKISSEEWELWLDEYFEPRSNAIIKEILDAKNNLKQSSIYTIDMEKDFETKTFSIISK